MKHLDSFIPYVHFQKISEFNIKCTQIPCTHLMIIDPETMMFKMFGFHFVWSIASFLSSFENAHFVALALRLTLILYSYFWTHLLIVKSIVRSVIKGITNHNLSQCKCDETTNKLIYNSINNRIIFIVM